MSRLNRICSPLVLVFLIFRVGSGWAASTAPHSTEKKGMPFFYLWYMVQQDRPLLLLLEPAILPPDLLAVPKEKNLSVLVVYDKDRYEVSFDGSGRRTLMPILWAGVYTPYSVVTIRRNISGLPINLEMPDKKIRMSVLEYEYNRPLRFQYEGEGEKAFGLLHYWGNKIDESWYSEAGELQAIYRYTLSQNRLICLDLIDEDGNPLPVARWEYNAQNFISAVEDQERRTELVYDEKRRLIAAVTHRGNEPLYRRYFQYDERGLLVRQYGQEGSKHFEYRYRYTRGYRDLWLICYAQPWEEQFGYLVPGSEVSITRTFSRSGKTSSKKTLELK